MEVAIEEDDKHKDEDAQSTIAVMVKKSLWYKMEKSSQIKQQEYDDELHQDED